MRRWIAAVACVVALATPLVPAAAQGRVTLGVEELLAHRLDLVRGKRVGLITNMSAIDSRGRADIDLLASAPGVHLTTIFAPEHGVRAELDIENIPDGRDPRTGVPIVSLYTRDRAPSPAQLAGLDVLVFDIQDSGSRFYTYTTTLGLCLEAAAKAHKPFVVLDRPNPITDRAEGDLLDPSFKHFTGRYPLTTRHGLTIGELARYIDGVEKLGAALTVVPMRGYRRGMWFDQTGLPWRRPSPAMLDADTALYYAGIGLFEATNVNCRAPGKPFRWIGAKWIDGRTLSFELNRLNLAGVSFAPERVGKEDGVRVRIHDRETFRPIEAAIAMMDTLHRRYGAKFEPYRSGLGHMTGSDTLWLALNDQATLDSVKARYHQATSDYDRMREPYRLYP